MLADTLQQLHAALSDSDPKFNSAAIDADGKAYLFACPVSYLTADTNIWVIDDISTDISEWLNCDLIESTLIAVGWDATHWRHTAIARDWRANDDHSYHAHCTPPTIDDLPF